MGPNNNIKIHFSEQTWVVFQKTNSEYGIWNTFFYRYIAVFNVIL